MGAIAVDGLGKFYKRYPAPSARLAEWLSAGALVRHECSWVLRDVAFRVEPGEALGVIGRNGAGKSTLLRLVNGTLAPSTGTVRVDGRVAALELGLRFHRELSGRQNLFLAGQLLGLPNAVVAERLPDIEAFSELGPHLDDPLRTYSAGMGLRLAFSVATAVRPDVLLVDEALAVGDARFQQKCVARIREFLRQGSCVLLVSHDPTTVRSLCDQALLIEEGRAMREGPPGAVLDYYNALLARIDAEYGIEQADPASGGPAQTRSGQGHAVTEEIELLDENGPARSFAVGASMRIRVRGRVERAVPDLTVGIAIRDRLGNDVFGTNSHHLLDEPQKLDAGECFDAEFRLPVNLGPGGYSLTVALHAGRTHLEGSYDWWDHALAFRVLPADEYFVGCAYLPTTLRIERRAGGAD